MQSNRAKDPNQAFVTLVCRRPGVTDFIRKTLSEYKDAFGGYQPETAVLQEEIGVGVDVRMLGGNNNLNILVSVENNSVVLQLSKRSFAVDTAMQQLGNPEWMATEYKVPEPFVDNAYSYDGDEMNPWRDGENACATFVECCHDSLEGYIGVKHDQNNDQGAVIYMADDVFAKLSALLNYCIEKNVIWTDLKIGNVLTRKDGGLVIADNKAFLSADNIRIVPVNGKPEVTLGNVTNDWYSKEFLENYGKCTRGELVQLMQKEYSYQMGNILYAALTNEEEHNYLRNHNNKQTSPNFNFNLPVFEGEQGQRLKTIIERLTHEDPLMRISYQDAGKLLNVINSEAEFNKQIVALNDDKLIIQDSLQPHVEWLAEAMPGAKLNVVEKTQLLAAGDNRKIVDELREKILERKHRDFIANSVSEKDPAKQLQVEDNELLVGAIGNPEAFNRAKIEIEAKQINRREKLDEIMRENEVELEPGEQRKFIPLIDKGEDITAMLKEVMEIKRRQEAYNNFAAIRIKDDKFGFEESYKKVSTQLFEAVTKVEDISDKEFNALVIMAERMIIGKEQARNPSMRPGEGKVDSFGGEKVEAKLNRGQGKLDTFGNKKVGTGISLDSDKPNSSDKQEKKRRGFISRTIRKIGEKMRGSSQGEEDFINAQEKGTERRVKFADEEKSVRFSSDTKDQNKEEQYNDPETPRGKFRK